jgi:hypothetical protein
MSSTDQLREQLDALQSSLQAFEAPIVDDYPGLRLMAQTLREREEHIRGQIAKDETCTITITLRRVTTDGVVTAGVVGALIAAADTAVSAAAGAETAAWSSAPPTSTIGAAASLHLRELGIDGNDLTLALTRPPGPPAAQLAHPESDAPFSEVVMGHVTTVLAEAAVDGTIRQPELADALQSLAEVVITTGGVLQWQLQPYVLRPQKVTVDQTAAQRILAHGPA